MSEGFQASGGRRLVHMVASSSSGIQKWLLPVTHVGGFENAGSSLKNLFDSTVTVVHL